jgi:hypothetical protein
MMRKNISTQLSNQVIKSEEESVRYSEYKINPLLLNRWSPRSMTGDEELSNEELCLFLKQQDGLHHPSILNPGGLFTQREIR